MTPEKPRLEWKEEKFSSHSAQAGPFYLSVFWDDTKGKLGYKFVLSMGVRSNKIFPDLNKAKIAAEGALEYLCKKALEQLESKDQVLVISKKKITRTN